MEDNKQELTVTMPLYEYRMLLESNIRANNLMMLNNDIMQRFNQIEKILFDILNKK